MLHMFFMLQVGGAEHENAVLQLHKDLQEELQQSPQEVHAGRVDTERFSLAAQFFLVPFKAHT